MASVSNPGKEEENEDIVDESGSADPQQQLKDVVDEQSQPSETLTAESGGSTDAVPYEEQKEFLKKHLQAQLRKGEEWYVLEIRWFKQWKKFVGFDMWDMDGAGEKSSHPGPIDLSPLYKEDSKANEKGVRSMKDGLIDELDYMLVPKLVWDKLVVWYGLAEGSEPLCRRVVEFGMFTKHCKVEVYLMEFQLSKLGEEKVAKKEAFSRGESLGKVKEAIKKAFGIPDEAECRLWNRYIASSYELLKNDDESIQETGLYSGQVIAIEVKNADGTWPRGEQGTFYASSSTSSSYSSSTNNTSSSKTSGSSYGTTSSSSGYFSSWGWGSSSKPSKPGLCGLSNLGNTCFMSSALQCMSNTPVLTEYFKAKRHEGELNRNNPLGMRGKIAVSYGRLLEEMWSGSVSVVAPRDFKSSVSQFAPQFSGYAQHDSHELLAFLLDGLHEDLNRIKKKPYVELKDSNGRPDEVVAAEAWENHKKRNDSVIVDLFQGQFKSTLVCPECSHVSVTFDPFMFLSLPLPTSKSQQIEVLLVHLSPAAQPVMYTVTVPKHGTVRDLRQKLAAMASVNPDCLVVTDVFNHRFHRIFMDNDPLSSIQDRDHINVYELAVSAADDPSMVCLPVYHRQPRTNYYYSSYSSSTLYMMGLPFFLCVPRKTTTYRSLYNTLVAQLEHLLRPEAKEKASFGEAKEEPKAKPRTLLERAQDAEEGTEMQNMQGVTEGNAAKTEDESEPMDVDKTDTSTESKDEEAMETNETGSANEANSDRSPSWNGDEDAADGGTSSLKDKAPQKDLFTINSVNSYGSTSLDTLRDDGTPLRLTDRTYLSLDWPKEELCAYMEKVSDEYDTHDSCKKNSNSQQKKSYNLYDCLELFTTEEQLGTNDPWYCPKCKKHQQAMKKFDLWKLPQVLVVHLKRFSYTKYWRDKLDLLIKFPLTGLDLSDMCLNQDDKAKAVYDLHAVSNHYGGMGGGHYTAYAKNKDDDRWHYFDDSSVSSADESQLESKAAYVLFYTRREHSIGDSTTGEAKREHESSGKSEESDISSNSTESALHSVE